MQRRDVVASDAPGRPVVCDTSPLINLAAVGLLDLLSALYGVIWVPEAVNREYMAGTRTGEPILEELSWVRIVRSVALHPELPSSLGAGEAEAISLAIAENARAIILDEQLARLLAALFHRGMVACLRHPATIKVRQPDKCHPIMRVSIRQGKQIRFAVLTP